jgi:hypothetical protein
MRIVACLILLASITRAEIVDRVAANIGRRVITDTEVEQEVRVEAFVEGVPVDLSAANKRRVLDRLVDQFLIRKELEFTRFAPVSDADVAPMPKQIRDRYSSEEAFKEALNKYQISADDLKKQVSWTLTMLRFIEYRFQPAVQVTQSQIRQEYRRRVADWKQRSDAAVPPLQQIQPEIEKLLRQRLVDAALDGWLGEARTQNDIVYHGEYKL